MNLLKKMGWIKPNNKIDISEVALDIVVMSLMSTGVYLIYIVAFTK